MDELVHNLCRLSNPELHCGSLRMVLHLKEGCWLAVNLLLGNFVL